MKNECKKWLDKVINNARESCALQHFNESIGLCIAPRDNIQIYSGIFTIAESVGATTTEETEYTEEYPYVYSFTYRGYQIFHLSKERMIKNAYAD